jgi:hypothetical protein
MTEWVVGNALAVCMPMQYQAIIHINLYTAIDIQVTVHHDIFLY